MRPIKLPDNLTTLAYKHIKTYVLEGKLKEGDRLTEEFISTTLGISKSPVREALNRLEAEGLIHIEPRKGASVRSFTPDEIADLYDLREALEVHAVGSAKITKGVISELRESVRRHRAYRKGDDKIAYIEEDVRFHSIVALATGNKLLCRELENLQNLLRLLRLKTYDISSSVAVEVHTKLAERLSHGDRSAAQDLMREHLRETCQKLLHHLSPSSDGDTEDVGEAASTSVSSPPAA